MKRIVLVFIICIASLASCELFSVDDFIGKTIKITGLPHAGEAIIALFSDDNVLQSFEDETVIPNAYSYANIVNGNATFKMLSGSDNSIWKKSGEFYVVMMDYKIDNKSSLLVYSAGDTATNVESRFNNALNVDKNTNGIRKYRYNIQDGVTTIDYSQFTDLIEYISY